MRTIYTGELEGFMKVATDPIYVASSDKWQEIGVTAGDLDDPYETVRIVRLENTLPKDVLRRWAYLLNQDCLLFYVDKTEYRLVEPVFIGSIWMLGIGERVDSVEEIDAVRNQGWS